MDVVIAFLAGMIIGGACGFIALALMTASREDDDQ